MAECLLQVHCADVSPGPESAITTHLLVLFIVLLLECGGMSGYDDLYHTCPPILSTS